MNRLLVLCCVCFFSLGGLAFSEEDKGGEVNVCSLCLYKDGHYYICVVNVWDDTGDVLFHSPSCPCGLGYIKMLEDLKGKQFKIPLVP
jgi:hypothetical protein